MNVMKKINEFSWADWSFDSCQIDYKDILIELTFNTEMYYNSDGSINDKFEISSTISCNNFIGFFYVGKWDENIIESIKIEAEGDLLSESLKKVRELYGPSPPLGGGIKDINKPWYQLNIKLIDGIIIKVVCESFSLDEESEKLLFSR